MEENASFLEQNAKGILRPHSTKKTVLDGLFYYAEVAVARTRSAVLRRLENIVVCHRLSKSAALHTRYFLRQFAERHIAATFDLTS